MLHYKHRTNSDRRNTMVEEKNKLRYTEKQLSIVLSFCKAIEKDPRISYSEFHRKTGDYSRKQSTIDLLNKAYQQNVIVGPYIYCNRNLEVNLQKNDRNPFKLLEEAKKNKEITFALALGGDWSFLSLKRTNGSKNILNHVSTIIPNHNAKCKIKDLYFEEEGKLDNDPCPQGWDELDWKVYGEMGAPRKVSITEVANKLNFSWKYIKKRFNKIMCQCKNLCYYLPLGYLGYHYIFLTFKTKYEVGLKKSLKKLDRSSYLQRFNDTIMLTLFLEPEAHSYTVAIDRFKELKEIGLIDDLLISIPHNWEKPHFDFPL